MKISSAIPSIGSAPDGGRSRPVSGTAPQPVQSPEAETTTSVLSSQLQEIAASVSSSPVVDAQRVAEIKQAIAEGRFKIDPERIADGLLSSVRQMLERNG